MSNLSNDSRSLKQLLSDWQIFTAGSNHPAPPVYDGPDINIVNLVEHTGAVVDGSCFVARVRPTSDGHPYIKPAIEQGAKLVLGQKPAAELGFAIPAEVVYWQVPDTAETVAWLAAAWHGFPSQHLTCVGVTGTDGKTSTINILYEIMRTAGLAVGMISTIKAVIGDVEESTGLHVSTPEAPAVQKYLRRMVDAEMTYCLLETTSHGLAQHRVSAIDFNVAVVTNITHEHLDYHGSYEAYYAAKRRLFEMVALGVGDKGKRGKGDKGRLAAVVLNRDDKSFDLLADILPEEQIHYGIDLPAHVMATEIEYSADATKFNCQWAMANSQLPMTTSLVGKFNVYNILAAVSAATVLGIPAVQIQQGVASIDNISGRMQRIDEGQNFLVIVDFAHTPNALEKAIQAARPMVAEQNGRVITVFGSAGKRDIEKRRMMAEISAQYADVTILTAEDPRNEPLENILEMMAAGCRRYGGVEADTFWRIHDRGEAIYFALALARPQDVVLVCGKGHEQSMNFDEVEYPWDDREATRAALQAFLAKRPMVDLGLPTFKR